MFIYFDDNNVRSYDALPTEKSLDEVYLRETHNNT